MEKCTSDPPAKLPADTPRPALADPRTHAQHLPSGNQLDSLNLQQSARLHIGYVWGQEGESSVLVQKHQLSQRASCQHSPATWVTQPPASAPDQLRWAGSIRDKAGTRSALQALTVQRVLCQASIFRATAQSVKGKRVVNE